MTNVCNRYLLNSAVITGPGAYRYDLVTSDEAATWLRAGPFLSRIGYQNTAEHIRELSGILPELSREATAMQPGDEALVVRLKYRLANPGSKTTHAPAPDAWEYGILRKEK